MKETLRATNIIDLASVYDIQDAIWFMDRDIFPSRFEYKNFIVNNEEWIKWIDDNFDIVNTLHKIKTTEENTKLRRVVAIGKNNKNTIISFSLNYINGIKIEIVNLTLLFSDILNPDFKIKDFENEIQKLKIDEDKKSFVYMIVDRCGSLDLQDFEIDIPELNLELNYGKEWTDKHEKLLEIFISKKKKGIVLLHGLPGTGKSMYIRHLISILSDRNKTIIYLPNQLIDCITDPSFIPLMSSYPNSILIIEDGDEAIKSRKNGGHTVDKLLNLADGILSDFLGTQIICTFNSDISTIDEALLRKGRLILKHKFEKLSIENSQKLSDKLGFKNKIDQEMTLADIYNQDDFLNNEVVQNQNKIGFGR